MIDLLAPISGTVVVKKAYQGQYIKTGEPLFEMGDLSKLWFHAEVYERDLPDIRIGEKAIIRTPTVPGREFPGVVTFIDPILTLRLAAPRCASRWRIRWRWRSAWVAEIAPTPGLC